MRVFLQLPIYVVIETSMCTEKFIGDVFDYLIKLNNILISQAWTCNLIRIEIITFNTNSQIVLPLSHAVQFFDWLGFNKESKFTHSHGADFGSAFKLLRERIVEGCKQIESEIALGNQKFGVCRPIVLFFADGYPTDDPNTLNKEFNLLVNESFKYRPNIFCLGFDEESKNLLKVFNTMVYLSPSGDYKYGNVNKMFTFEKIIYIISSLHDIPKEFFLIEYDD